MNLELIKSDEFAEGLYKDKVIQVDSSKTGTQQDEMVAVQWCKYASEYMLKYNGKPWVYVLIPHDAIAQNMTIKGLGDRFKVK